MTIRAVINNNNIIGIIDDAHIDSSKYLKFMVSASSVEVSILPLSLINLDEYKFSNKLYEIIQIIRNKCRFT